MGSILIISFNISLIFCLFQTINRPKKLNILPHAIDQYQNQEQNLSVREFLISPSVSECSWRSSTFSRAAETQFLCCCYCVVTMWLIKSVALARSGPARPDSETRTRSTLSRLYYFSHTQSAGAAAEPPRSSGLEPGPGPGLGPGPGPDGAPQPLLFSHFLPMPS